MKNKWIRFGIPILFLVLFLVWVVRLNQIEKLELISRNGQTFEKGIVTEILQDNIQENGTRIGEQTLLIRMLSGIRKGEEIQTTSSAGYLFGAACTKGMKVIVMQSIAGDSTISSVYARDRSMTIYLFAGLYLLALCLVGGWKGVKGALGLVFTFFSIIFCYLPMVYNGTSPFWAAVLICVITTVVTMYLVGGPTKKTVVATMGTTAGVIIAGTAATLFSMASGISGYNVSDIENLLVLWDTNDIQVGGLLFSGLLISSLGATMDVAMSIASSMQEIYAQNESISAKELFKAGMRVGRDMMGTDSNTLILAFAGGSISMLMLDYAYDLPYLQIINSNNIGIAIMQGLAGSFGVVLSVPVTVLLATILFHKRDRQTK